MFITHRDNFPHPGDVHSSLRIGDGNAEATVSEFDEIDAVGLDTVRLNTMVRVAYDDVEVTAYTVDGDVQQITFRSNTEDVAVINVTYNADGDFQRAKVTYV
jgi:hypothetical protein